MKISHHFGGIYGIYPNLMKKNWKISICYWLDLETLGFWPIMPINVSNDINFMKNFQEISNEHVMQFMPH